MFMLHPDINHTSSAR